MDTLLISSSTNWICGGIMGFFLLFGLSVIAWGMGAAACYEHDEDPIAPDDMKPVSYSEIIDNERPYEEQFMYS